MDEITGQVGGWEAVLVLRPGPGDGAPEVSWAMSSSTSLLTARSQLGSRSRRSSPRTTRVNPLPGLDRPGAFRVNIAAHRPACRDAPDAQAAGDPSTPDLLMSHPTYGDLGWVAVVNPAERTSEQVLALLRDAHAAALARWRRRHDTSGAEE